MSDQLHADSRNITACFTGHRQLPASELPALVVRLDAVLEALCQRGYRRFICGGALGFDTVAAERVVSMQLLHPDVRLIMALPCGDQTKSWRTEDCRRYERMLYTADETHVLSPVYYAGCMMVRNRRRVAFFSPIIPESSSDSPSRGCWCRGRGDWRHPGSRCSSSAGNPASQCLRPGSSPLCTSLVAARRLWISMGRKCWR